MKKLKSLSKDNLPKRLEKIDTEYQMNEIIGFLTGFEAGFQEAFKVINERIEARKLEYSEYPLMSERKASMIDMQKKLNELLKEMVGNYE